MLQAGVQHLVFSGLIDPRPFKLALPVDPNSGRQIPHFETKAQIKVPKCCLASAVAYNLCYKCMYHGSDTALHNIA